MAFLAECPCCRRRKRVDEHRRSDGAFPIVDCPRCSVAFATWPDENGVAIGIELQPGALTVRPICEVARINRSGCRMDARPAWMLARSSSPRSLTGADRW